VACSWAACAGDITQVGTQAREAALEARQQKAAKYRADILLLIEEHQKNGATTLTAIAAALNAEGTPAPRGGEWSAVQVKRILDSGF
jgi:Recombinase-like helix-turn-helix domain